MRTHGWQPERASHPGSSADAQFLKLATCKRGSGKLAGSEPSCARSARPAAVIVRDGGGGDGSGCRRKR